MEISLIVAGCGFDSLLLGRDQGAPGARLGLLTIGLQLQVAGIMLGLVFFKKKFISFWEIFPFSVQSGEHDESVHRVSS